MNACMMKISLRLLLAFLTLPLLLSLCALPGLAAEGDLKEELAREIRPEEGLRSEVLQQIGPYDGAVEGIGARALELLGRSLARLPETGLREGLRCLGMLLASALLCALLEDSPRGKAAVPLVGTLCVGAACLPAFGGMIPLGTEMIRELHTYTRLLLPVMGSLMALSGSPASAAVSGLGMGLLDLLQSLIPELLVPMLYLFLLLSFGEAGLGLSQLGQLRRFLLWLLSTGVKLLMWGYSGVLSLTGLVAGSLDAQKLRLLRSAIAGMVPVVGGLVSEASGSLLSAAALLRSSVGLYGLLAVLGICLGPFLRIGLQYLLLKLGTGLCGLFGRGSQGALLEQLSRAMGLVLAFSAMAGLFSLMILVLCIRTVNP